MKRHLKQNGYDLDELVERCRNFKTLVPVYENLIGAQFIVGADGDETSFKVKVIDGETGHEINVLEGEGIVNLKDYWRCFELSVSDFEQSIISENYDKFLSAVNSGIASIEAYLNYQYLLISP